MRVRREYAGTSQVERGDVVKLARFLGRFHRRVILRAICLLPISLLIPSVAMADGAALFEKHGCTSCHGKMGQGIEGLAPALKGNAFVASASLEEIKETILKGRAGKNKRHPNIRGGMPAAPVPESEIDPLAAYVKGDLQK